MANILANRPTLSPMALAVRRQADQGLWKVSIVKTDEGYEKRLKAHKYDLDGSVIPVTLNEYDFAIKSVQKKVKLLDGTFTTVYCFEWSSGHYDIVKTGDAAIDKAIEDAVVKNTGRYLDDSPQHESIMTFRKQSRSLGVRRQFEQPF